MPTDIDDYVHRIGRTGRAGKAGLATAFISEENTNIIHKLLEILDYASQEIPSWLETMNAKGHRGHSNRGHRGGTPRFGGRDFRRERDNDRGYSSPRNNNYDNREDRDKLSSSHDNHRNDNRDTNRDNNRDNRGDRDRLVVSHGDSNRNKGDTPKSSNVSWW